MSLNILINKQCSVLSYENNSTILFFNFKSFGSFTICAKSSPNKYDLHSPERLICHKVHNTSQYKKS